MLRDCCFRSATDSSAVSVSTKELTDLSKKPPPFLNTKGGGFKALDASDQSIADLLKKKMVANDFISEISFHFRWDDYMLCRTVLSTVLFVF